MIQYFWRRRVSGAVGNYVNALGRALSDLGIKLAPFVNGVVFSDLGVKIAPYVNWASDSLNDQNALIVELNLNADITDRSLYANTTYFNAFTTFAITTSDKKYGAGSLSLDQEALVSVNGLFIDGSRPLLMAIGASDFTIQLFCKWTAYTNSASVFSPAFVSNQGSFVFGLRANNLRFSYELESSSGEASYSFTPTLNQWYHIAVTRKNNQLVFWVDGVPSSEITVPNFELGANTLRVGLSGSLDTFEGFFDEIQIRKDAIVPIVVPTGGY